MLFFHLGRRSVELIFIFLCLSGISFSGHLRAATATVPLHDLPPNSRFAIWGDSITEVTFYPRFVEMYLLACAGRKDIKVCTFGHSGETAGALLSRTSDLDAFHPTIVSFNYGMNDTQYSPYTEAKGAGYDKNIRDSLALLAARGITQRIVAGPTLVDDTFTRENFFSGGNPDGLTAIQAQGITLDHFSSIALKAAADTGSAVADVHNRMKDTYAAAKQALGSYSFAKPGGGIHPSANGHLMIAFELLKALSCDGDIGTFNVDMKGGATASTGHTVVSCSNGVLVVDSSKYPFCYNYDPNNRQDPESIASILPFLPFSQELNRFMLVVTNLDAPSADVTWGSETKSFTKEQLAKGINLAEQFDRTPFDITFAKVMEAIVNKETFENFMIKGTSNYFGNDNGGNVDANMIAVQEEKDAWVKAMIIPVRHTIVIVPTGAEAGAPVITGTMTAYPVIGQPLTYQVSALNAPTGYDAKGLPAGLTIDAASGRISGTPTEAFKGTVQLSATNAKGSGTGVLTLAIAPPLPGLIQITSPATATATVGTPFSYQIVGTNHPEHFFATSPGDKGTEPPASSLPPGLTYDTTSGLVSGTPTKAGTFIVQVAAMNEAGVSPLLVTLTVKDK
jgi:lysophospholipase L1-like esterase